MNDLCYLEKVFSSESGYTCPWVLAIGRQDDSQASLRIGCKLDGSLCIHNAVRHTSTSLWIINVAQ